MADFPRIEIVIGGRRIGREGRVTRPVRNPATGDPTLIAGALLALLAVRKISFAGAGAVGKNRAELAGRHMKRATMEPGGHAPVQVFDDAAPGAVAPINHFGLALAETPFGGINDSGHGSEGYPNTGFVSRMSNPVT